MVLDIHTIIKPRVRVIGDSSSKYMLYFFGLSIIKLHDVI